MTSLTVFKSEGHLANNTYPTKAEFVATMQQLYGDRVSYTDMHGVAKDIDSLVDGRLYVDGEYVGFWAVN